MSINLEFFVADTPFKYNIDGLLLLQDIQFRIKETPLFLGARIDLPVNEAENGPHARIRTSRPNRSWGSPPVS